MDKARRKRLLHECAQKPPIVGVFAVRNAATGEAWVGWSKSLDKRQNGIWAQLRMGTSPGAPGLLESWRAHGEAAFSHERLELIREDNPHTLETLLKERAAHWRRDLNGRPISSR